jgi:hypothetical protein
MTMRPYFPLALQISAAACQRLQLAPPVLAPPRGQERFALRQVAAALQASSSASAPSGAQVNLLAQLSRAFRFIAARSLAALSAPLAEKEFTATAAVFRRLYPPGRPAEEGAVAPVEIAVAAATSRAVRST